jgi:hypothetical protein
MTNTAIILAVSALLSTLPACGRDANKAAPEATKAPVAKEVRWLTRAHWGIAWSAYRDVVPATSTAPAVRAPAPGAKAVVIDLEATDASTPAMAGGPRRNLLEQVEPLRLAAGEVVELFVENDEAEAVGISGDAANAYWTSSGAIVSFSSGKITRTPFASLYVQGLKPGRGDITVKWGNAEQKLIVQVSR